CDLTFVHLYWPPEQYARLGLRGARDLFETDPEVVNVLKRDLRDKVGDMPGRGRVDLVVRPSWGRYGDAVATAAEEQGADFVVVGTHQRRGLARVAYESVSRELLQAARLPVVCVPTGYAEVKPAE